MALTIPDDLLRGAGLSESEAKLEIACRLFEAGRLDFWPAARWAGLTRVGFEEELLRRGIFLHRPTAEELDADLRAMERMGV
jgi:predicted HTH domain antitoxin